MNRIVLIVGIIVTITAASCKKNRTCSCTSNYTGADTNWTATNDIIIEKQKKDEAEETCQSNNKNTTLLTETLVVECRLD